MDAILQRFKLQQGLGLTYGILAAALCFLYLSIFVLQARVDIRMEMESPQPSYFRIYWAVADQAFSESRMAYAQIDTAHSEARLYIASLGNIDRIRIDPVEFATRLNLQELRISQYGYAPISLQLDVPIKQLRPNRQLSILGEGVNGGLDLETTGGDGNLELALEPQRHWTLPLGPLLILCTLLAGLALALIALRPLFPRYRFVPWILGLVFVLTLAMAMTTGLHLHPDEVVHLEAVKYYARHLLPPSLDAAEIADSYSIYGHSRLSQLEIYYLVAGYIQALPAQLSASPLFAARSFNLLLFAALVLLAFRREASRPILLPLLISAQAWYLFSYTNSDAIALTLTFFVAYLVTWPGSLLNRFLTEPHPPAFIPLMIALGLLFGSLLLLKANYYAFILFLGLYLLWRIRQGDFPDRKRLWLRLLMLALVALGLFALRLALDVHANGWNRAELNMQMQEEYAIEAYKPSTPRELRNPMLNLRDQGFSLGYTLVNARWFEKTFQSAFGVYGFSDHFAPAHYYDLVRLLGVLLLVMLLFGALKGYRQGILSLLLLVALCALLLISASIWNSWTVAFQAQGRYLMPLLPMLGIYYYHAHAHSPRGLIECLCLLLFLLALYSFAFIGIENMSSLTSSPAIQGEG